MFGFTNLGATPEPPPDHHAGCLRAIGDALSTSDLPGTQISREEKFVVALWIAGYTIVPVTTS